MWHSSTIYVIVSVSVAALVAVPSLALLAVARSRKVNLKLLQAERDRLDACFESSPVGMILFNESRVLIRANRAAALLVKGEVGDLLNQRQGDALKCVHRASSPQGCGFSAECLLCPLRKALVSVLEEDRRVVGVEAPMTLVRDGAVRKVWLRMGAQPFMLDGKRYVIVALDDITEAKQTFDKLQQTSVELERMNDEVRAASKAKSQFLANMSHEIRTPLNGIIGMTDLLLGTELQEGQRNFADVIHASGEALLSVVNDILDFSKIEADKIVLDHEAFDLQHCLEEVFHFVAPAAAKKKLELVCQLETSLQPLWIGDSVRLRQILVNLVGNAVKFTERGEVVVRVTGKKLDSQRFQLDFTVRDTGVGIPPEQQKRLFQSFSQVDTSSVRRFGGTGLGLVISKRLCELMGGTITVESKGVPGRGSAFSFSIVVETEPGGAEAVGREPPAVLQGKRVLIVDAHPTSREEAMRQVESWRMSAQAVASGSAAGDVLRGEAPFDVALISYGMPDVNGLKLAEEIRQLPGRSEMRLLLFSPLGECVAGWEHVHIGACLSKPVLPARLQDALVCALAVRQMEAVRAESAARVSQDADVRPGSLRILVAEDNAVNQRVVLGFLERLGYRADVVANGLDAVDAVKRTRYDVVLMDGQMPEMDGEQATVLIRKEVAPERQPWIVAMTANVLKGDRERYLASGMNEYLPKPIRADALTRVLRAAPRAAGPR